MRSKLKLSHDFSKSNHTYSIIITLCLPVNLNHSVQKCTTTKTYTRVSRHELSNSKQKQAILISFSFPPSLLESWSWSWSLAWVQWVVSSLLLEPWDLDGVERTSRRRIRPFQSAFQPPLGPYVTPGPPKWNLFFLLRAITIEMAPRGRNKQGSCASSISSIFLYCSLQKSEILY